MNLETRKKLKIIIVIIKSGASSGRVINMENVKLQHLKPAFSRVLNFNLLKNWCSINTPFHGS